MSTLQAFNQTVFLHINADLLTRPWIIIAAKFLANWLIYLVPTVLIGIWCWGEELQRKLALKTLIVILAVLTVNQLVGAAWPQPRPFMLKKGHTFFAHAGTPSFPSNHASICWAVSIVLLTHNIRSILGWLVFIASCGVAWARVFLGVHFPLDMLGALCVAGVVCFVVNLIWHRIDNSLNKSAVRFYRLILAYPIAKGWLRE